MISRHRAGLALASLLSLVGLSAMPAGATTVPTVHVTIQMFAFTPTSATAHLGYIVKWTNADTVAHTSTSNQGFWGSQHIAPGGSYSRTFNQAGTFAYHCAIHTEMHGRVLVPMRASARTGGGTLVWARVAGHYDVQVERPHSTTWVTLRSSTTAESMTFTTKSTGRFLFRARTHISSTVSGWSPAVAVWVS